LPIITYKGQGGTADPEVYEFEWADFRWPDAVEVQKLWGKPWPEAKPAVLLGDWEPLGYILFVLMKKNEPDLLPDMFFPDLMPEREITVEFTKAELRQILVGLTALAPHEQTAESRAAVASLQERLAESVDLDDEGDDEAPKA